MRLEEIGFYTLSDARAERVSSTSPLQRCELILTDACNFNCTYCRGMQKEDKGHMGRIQALSTVRKWAKDGLVSIRFSGGEPTMWPYLNNIVQRAKEWGISNIALSTNGSASIARYLELIKLGVNDFSISLDACCSSTGKTMAGGVDIFDRVTENIKSLSEIAYVTVGTVLTDENYGEVGKTIEFASELGVDDIRIIPAAQVSKKLKSVTVAEDLLKKFPILRYRVNNIREGRPVRGLNEGDNRRCPLVLDDMAVMNNKHYPCIIYMREHGQAIGTVSGREMSYIRQQRSNWSATHDVHNDPICSSNCLDVCVDYNNRVRDYHRAVSK